MKQGLLPRLLAVVGWVAVLPGLFSPANAAPPSDQQAHAHLEEMARNGVLRDPFWGHAYHTRAHQAPDDVTRASDLQWALRFDPDLNSARWELVALQIRQRDPEFATNALEALRVGVGSFPSQQRLGVWIFTLAFGALAGTLMLLAILAVARVVPRIHHAIYERLNFLPVEVRAGATLLTLVAPVLLPLTLAPTAALFWLLLLGTAGAWTLLDRWERRTAVAALLVILLSPVALGAWVRLTAPGNPTSYLRALWATQYGVDEQDTATVRAAPTPTTESDPAYWASLALAERRQNRFRNAGRYLETAIGLEPGNWSHRNNLGNVQLLAGQVDEALASYRTARELAPNEPLVRVNEAQAWVQKLEFARADAALAEAKRLGYHLPPMRESGGADLVVHDRTLDSGVLWLRFAEGRDHSYGLEPRRAGAMIVALLFPVRPTWMSIPLFLALWYVALARSLPRSFACSSCGKSICRKCHYRVMRRSLCAHCHAIRRDVHAPLRRAQLLEERHRRVMRWGRAFAIVSSVLFPGSGLAVRGLPRRAAGLLALSLVLALAAAADVVWPDPTSATGRAGVPLAVPLALYAIASITSVVGYLRAPETHLQEPQPRAAPGPV